MATPGKQPKAMSSRLAGMKFMQRASLGGNATPPTPSTPAEPPSKKQRLSNGSSIRSPATPIDTPQVQQKVAAAEREASNKAESRWYLSYKPPQGAVAESPLRIVSAGFASLDAVGRAGAQSGEDGEDDENQRPPLAGRKSFGNFSRKVKKEQASDDEGPEHDDDEDEEEEGEVEDDPTGVKALIAQGEREARERARADRKVKKQEDAAESARLAALRRTKERNLNKPLSISNGGARKSKGPPSNKDMVCYKCGQKGHPKMNCPN